MAEVGKPRIPRVPTGPKIIDVPVISVDETILEPETITQKVETKESEFEELKRAKIPAPPARKIGNEDTKLTYDYLYSLKPEHWAQLSWYFYRSFPRIIRPDNERYIDCGSFAINEEWILKTHGSGDYMLILNDSGKPKNAKTMLTAVMKYNDPNYPPVVKMDELDVHYPGNRFFVDKMIAEGKLTTDKKPMNNTNQNNGGLSDQIILKLLDKVDKQQINNTRIDDPKDSAIKAAFEIIGQGNKAATQMMLDQMKENDPDKLIKLVTLIMGMMPKPVEVKDDSSGQMMKFLEIMQKKDDTIMGLMIKMMEKQNTPPPPPEDSFDKFLDRFSKFSELTGMGEGSGKKSTLETVMQYAAPLLGNVAGIIQNMTAIRAQGLPKLDPQTGQEIPDSVNKPGASGIPVSISAAPPTPGMPSNEQNTNGVAGAMENNAMMQEQMIKQGLKQIGPQLLNALNRGMTGDAFAQSLEGMYGPMAYNQLSSLGSEKILEVLKSDQQLWQQLSTIEPILVKFIKDFIEYGVEEDEIQIDPIENIGDKIQ